MVRRLTIGGERLATVAALPGSGKTTALRAAAEAWAEAGILGHGVAGAWSASGELGGAEGGWSGSRLLGLGLRSRPCAIACLRRDHRIAVGQLPPSVVHRRSAGPSLPRSGRLSICGRWSGRPR